MQRSAPYGGYTEVARRLSDAGPRPVSRQGVRAWYLSSKRNGFPRFHHLNDEGHRMWDISEVMSWYARYIPPSTSHWGRGGKKKE